MKYPRSKPEKWMFMKEVKRIANAKINLGLDVVTKREDGYHDLRMVMETITLHDKLRLKKIRKDEVVLKTNLPYLPTDERNLVVQIIHHIKKKYNIGTGVFADLYKVIPVGAGLAGGSADAAQTILGMNELFDLGMTMDEMLAMGVQFGADIPYCILGGAMLAEGIGDQLSAIHQPMCLELVVVKPKVSVSTPYVFKHLKAESIVNHPNIDALVKALNEENLDEVIQYMGNVLEEVTFEGYPQVLEVKKAIMATGAKGALMSGSGSAVFGIYNSREDCKIAAKKLSTNPLVRNAFVAQTRGMIEREGK